jgi:hypothetical protein
VVVDEDMDDTLLEGRVGWVSLPVPEPDLRRSEAAVSKCGRW